MTYIDYIAQNHQHPFQIFDIRRISGKQNCWVILGGGHIVLAYAYHSQLICKSDFVLLLEATFISIQVLTLPF